MRKAIFGIVVVGLLIWAVQFMRSQQTENADAVISTPPAATQQDAAKAIDSGLKSATGSSAAEWAEQAKTTADAAAAQASQAAAQAGEAAAQAGQAATQAASEAASSLNQAATTIPAAPGSTGATSTTQQ